MKNIVIQDGLGANSFIRKSLCNGFRLAGYPTLMWNSEGKSAFDLFDEVKDVSLFIGSTWQLDRSLIKKLCANPNIKVILYGDIWGSIQDSLDLNKYPVGVATQEQISNVKKLIDGGANVRNIISNHGAAHVDSTHGYWHTLGLDIHSVLVSADITQYYPRPKDEKYNVQLAYVGGMWTFKSRNLDAYITPLFYPNTKNWKIRVFGGGWNSIHSLGNITNDDAAKFYRNTQIIPHIVEPHASDVYSDIPLRYVEVAACQGFGISCPVVGIDEIFNKDELIVADDPKDFTEKVVYYLNNPEETIPYRLAAYKKVMSEHTNIHRCRTLMKMIDEDTSPLDNVIEHIQVNYGG